jgi:hypothetical protein
MLPKTFLFVLSVSLCFAHYASAQTLDQFDMKKGFTTTGSISLNAVGYHAWKIEGRRDPFNYFLNGNLTLSLFGYSAPFTFSYSNAQSRFTQPFNQFKIMPQYKWIRLYMGNTSMNFSDYTLAGHLFLGYGIELTPKKWKISLMKGRLRKEVAYDLNDTLQHKEASYKRMGIGAKLRYEGEKQQWGIIFFRAKDDPNSLEFVLPTNPITPQQNVAMGINGKRNIGKVSVDFEYSFSYLNTNILADKNTQNLTKIQNNSLIRALLPESNATSRYFDAFQTSIGYQGSKAGINLKYERISPEYQTLGAYFFNNDMENWTVQPTLKLFKGKVNFSGQVGLQRNNLDATRNATTKRWVSNVSLNFTPKQTWSFSGNYSNFSSYTRMRPQPDPFFRDPLDSLNFYQISHTATATATHTFGSKTRKQNFLFTGSYQQAVDVAAYIAEKAQPSRFYNATTSYGINISEKQLSVQIGVNGFLNILQGLENIFIGPTLSAGKSLFNKKIKASLGSSYSYTTTNGASAGDVLNGRMSFQYVPPKSKEKEKGALKGEKEKKEKKKPSQNFSFNLNYVKRFGTKGYSELTATFNAGFNF